MVEHSLITAASAAAAAGAKSTSKPVGGVFQSLGEILNKAADNGKAANPAATGSEAVVTAAKAAPRPVAESKIVEPSQITMGLERDELIARFGVPLITAIDTTTSQVVERMWYASGRSTQVQIELVGGKVASIFPPPVRAPDLKK